MYLKRIWPKVKLGEYADTAKAAEDLAKGKLPKTTAVIASRNAAQMHKLKILDESIQDIKLAQVTTLNFSKSGGLVWGSTT